MIIERYIFKKCLFNTILVLLSFVVLFAVFTILGDLGSLGKGDFGIWSMAVYIGALLPSFTYLLLPLAVLIGVMLGMLSLVNYSEYAIIRTSGVSLRRITVILGVYGLLFTGVTFFLGEVFAPKADHFAKVYKMTKLKQLVSTNLQSGIWSKDGQNTFVNIKQVMPNDAILGVSVYYYDANLELKKYLYANEGDFDNNNKVWTLKNVTLNEYTPTAIVTTNQSTYEWKTSIDPSYFNVLVISPEEMSAFSLIKYIGHLRENHQSVRRYEIAFWGKLIYPIACLSMALLAIAFIPNNRRSVNLGTKLFFGILIGISFFFITKLIGYMAVYFSWNPILSAIGPTAVLFAIGWYFIIHKDK